MGGKLRAAAVEHGYRAARTDDPHLEFLRAQDACFETMNGADPDGTKWSKMMGSARHPAVNGSVQRRGKRTLTVP